MYACTNIVNHVISLNACAVMHGLTVTVAEVLVYILEPRKTAVSISN